MVQGKVTALRLRTEHDRQLGAPHQCCATCTGGAEDQSLVSQTHHR